MNLLFNLSRALRLVFSAIFRRHLSLRVARGGRGVTLKVTLKDDPQLASGLPSRTEAAARRRQQDYALMQVQLAELLDDLPETRATMRHLVFVEAALQRKGLRALQKLPLGVLQHALEQLERLVVNWSPAGLAALRSRMAVAIIEREQQSGAAEADAYQTAAMVDTLPADEFSTGVDVSTDDDALTAAYAALGNLAPLASDSRAEAGAEAGAEPVAAAARAATPVS